MSDGQRRRLRDPIHGLIVFDDKSETDQLAWQLIQTPEFQRLRRIRQLGISELVFPGATHTRFSHSIGVYYCARRLMKVIKRKEGHSFNTDRARVALIAALLHDLGHGPFSHAFEDAREAIAEDRGQSGHVKSHEYFTAEIIQNEEGGIRRILGDNLAKQVADLVRADNPADIYHAVVSSSFDADRMDYLMRDRYMTGTGAGAIDLDWLMDNLTTYRMPILQDDFKDEIATFVFKAKGRQAAEDFLLARYRLYTQVYLHKTTRGFEKILSALFQNLGAHLRNGYNLGLGAEHPIVRFMGHDGETVANYCNLDDTVVWGAIEHLCHCDIDVISQLSSRLWQRKPLKVLDIYAKMDHNSDEKLFYSACRNALHRLDERYSERTRHDVFRDKAGCNLYSEVGNATSRVHKSVRVLVNGYPREIHEFPDTIINNSLTKKREIVRFYFLSGAERDAAEKVMKGD